MAPKVIVVGAGPGGLAASLMLAKAGIDVTVIEKSATVGGRTKVIERDGFKFDLGPTLRQHVQAQAAPSVCTAGPDTQGVGLGRFELIISAVADAWVWGGVLV